jgi:hypothetical protein
MKNSELKAEIKYLFDMFESSTRSNDGDYIKYIDASDFNKLIDQIVRVATKDKGNN